MWMSNDRSKMEGILDTEWKAHYTYEKQPASRVMFQAPNKTKSSDPGINVYEQEQMFEDYVEDEVKLVVITRRYSSVICNCCALV